MTFDLTAMFLMALGVIFTCGVLLMIGYAKASRVRRPAPAPVDEEQRVTRGSSSYAGQH